MDPAGQLMVDVPVSGACALYRGERFRILFGGDDWVAVFAGAEVAIPDAFARGESTAGRHRPEPWAKLPMSVLDGIIDIAVTAVMGGRTVSLLWRLPDGRVGVEFVGPPAAAKELGLDGDQYMGWTGLFEPEDLQDVHVEETRRA